MTILNTLKQYIDDSISLLNISKKHLEENGAIYYMNGQNGTEFEYYVNNHLPSFMVFYNDKDHLGAVKLNLYTDGTICLYLFNQQGQHLFKEETYHLDVQEEDILNLAVILKNQADDKLLWDMNINNFNINKTPLKAEKLEFIDNKKYYLDIIHKKELLSRLCVVSKKITEEGYKVGYMIKETQRDNQDSGWQFMSGLEDDIYVEDIHHFSLCYVNSIVQIDESIMSYIDTEDNTALIKISKDTFEVDQGQEPYIEKWK